MEEFARSDLAAECGAGQEGDGVRVQQVTVGGCEILRVQIKTREASARIGKPEGRYVTVDCGEIRALDELERERVRCALAVEIRDMAERMCGRRIGRDLSVLVVGLGNEEITPDALGPKTAKSLSVTRHFPKSAALLPGGISCDLSAIVPGVSGQTGVESAEIVRGAVREVAPDLVIAVDALAARSLSRLSTTVQLSDTGILPGSGLGAPRAALDQARIGVPVMALGVPTVVNSATLVCDALRLAGYGTLSGEIRKTVANGQSFFVSPSEVDVLVEAAALLLAEALEKAFTLP